MGELDDLDPRDRLLLSQHERNHPRIVALGVLILVLGLAYTGWGLLRFDPRGSLDDHASFDRPLTALTRVYLPYQGALRAMRPASDTELLLVQTLKAGINFSAGIMITLMRFILGLVMILSGLFMLTVAFERRRLVQIVRRAQS